MKRVSVVLLAALWMLSFLTGCGTTKQQANDEVINDGQSVEEQSGDAEAEENEKRKTITMWFWGTSDYQREAMEKYLVDGFNASQQSYTLEVEYRSSVDNDIAVALSGQGGPDLVYGSGPSFVAGYAAEGLLLDLSSYAEEYGWKDRMVDAFYDLCSVDGKLYSIPGGVGNYGIFYNQKVLDIYGWEVPDTYDELLSIMDEAMEQGLYGGLIGAKDWRYTNEWPVSMLFTSVAGPQNVYQCLSGQQKWNSDAMVEAVNEMVLWYEKGYMGGEDYWNLDANEAFQQLLDGNTPFCFAPLNGFQWAKNVATDESQLDNLGFMLLPSKDGSEPAVTLGVMCTFSINAQCENPDGAAAVMDYMLSAEFAGNMSSEWPGYWGIPVKDFANVDSDSYQGLSKQYVDACVSVIDALNNGNFGYAAATCFPASTYEACIDIDTVWYGEQTAEEYLDGMDTAYAEDVSANVVTALPAPMVQSD